LTKSKVEAFVHGAMCTSISGRCYFSQSIHDSPEFSANRGKCLQPCRKQWKVLYENGQEFDYDGYFFINAKDLCMIEYIPEMIQAGIASFKVEGRMRSPHYIEVVGKIYRTAIEAYESNMYSKERASEWKKELAKVYNRGFSTGFYFGTPTSQDVSGQKSGNQAETRKIEVGRVITYYRNQHVAKIFLQKGQFRMGDTIYFEGKESGYVRLELKEMKHKNRLITETPNISDRTDGYLMTVKVNESVKQADKVYIYS